MAEVDNKQLVEKAVIATDALASQGKLNPAQSDKFIDYVFDLSGLKNNARTIRFRNEQLYIDKIGVGKRLAQPAAEATAPTNRRGVSTSRITLQPLEIIVPFEISDTFREINLEGEAVEDRIIRMMAAQLANDMEQLYIEGDALGRAAIEGDILDGGSTTQYVQDAYLGMGNGWLRAADGAHVYDAQGQNIGSNVFSQALNAMPPKFKRNRQELRYMTSVNLEQNYRERVSTRATQQGDNALSSTQNLTPFGIQLVPFNLYPFKYREVEHIILTSTTAVQLRRSAVANVVVLPSTLASTATAAYLPSTNGTNNDYTITSTGSIARTSASAINSGATVKVTYDANPTLLLTHYSNLIVGIGRDVRIERDRDIFKRVNQYVITAKVTMNVEETDALVKVVNLGTGV